MVDGRELYPQDLGLILSYYCNSACKHCLYNCGPRWEREAITTEALEEALEAVIVWPRPPQVHFTGGEPFLHFQRLLEGTHMAVERGIRCYVETSASWCMDEIDVRRRFSELKHAGMQAILVSCSPFHAEKIPPVRTLLAVRAALEIFGPQGTIVYLPEFLKIVQQFELERPTPLSRYEEILGKEEAGRILWGGYGIISGGRSGYHLGHLVPSYPVEAFEGATCAAEILHAHHSHFDLYGNYISGFCGGLTVGSWRALPQLLNDYRAGYYPLLIEKLIVDGPYGLYTLARENYGYRALEGGYAGKCHLCVDVRRHLAEEEGFAELEPRAFYENIG
jgi:hypothetical protein